MNDAGASLTATLRPWLAAGFVLAVLSAPLVVPAAVQRGETGRREFVSPPQYTGTSSCRLCHRAIYESWSRTVHATERSPAEAACRSCHMTGELEPLVGCEACHGPGEYYSPAEVMLDRTKAVSAGLRPLNETICQDCHDRQAMPEDHAGRDIPDPGEWGQAVHPPARN